MSNVSNIALKVIEKMQEQGLEIEKAYISVQANIISTHATKQKFLTFDINAISQDYEGFTPNFEDVESIAKAVEEVFEDTLIDLSGYDWAGASSVALTYDNDDDLIRGHAVINENFTN